MRIAILAHFPAHFLPGLESQVPRGHYPTWLPQISAAWEGVTEFEFHWVSVSRHIQRDQPVAWRGQYFHHVHVPDRMRFLRLYWKDCRLIRKRLDGIQPDLVHAWGTEDCYGLAAVRSGRRFLLSMQGILSEYCRLTSMHPYERFQALIERYILSRTRHITAESTWGCEVMRRLVPTAETIDQVEYGVSDFFYHQTWQPDPQRPVALFVGTSEPRKGLQDLMAAMRDPRLAQYELRVLGDGPLTARLKANSPANVRWLGRLGREETAREMTHAWCLVLPTRADTSPNVVKEARVIGLPVITTAAGGQRDYVIDGETGWIVPPGEVERLTDRLAVTLGDLALARRLGATRREEHRAWFRPENTARGFLELYRRLGT